MMVHMEQYGLVFEGYLSGEREPVERQIAATDKQIDELVYQLYGLTEEGIKVVEYF